MTHLRLLEAHRGGYNGASGWWLRLEYSESGIEALKAAIPARLRTWDEESKRWWINASIQEQALELIPGLQAHLGQGALF